MPTPPQDRRRDPDALALRAVLIDLSAWAEREDIPPEVAAGMMEHVDRIRRALGEIR